jgi:hypothetical protein
LNLLSLLIMKLIVTGDERGRTGPSVLFFE